MFLQVMKAQELAEFYTKRWNETKLGETIKTLPNGKLCASSLIEARQAGARYAILGIPEDIGPRANGGRSGCSGAWKAFLKYFLNQQSNCFLTGEDLLLAGSICCDDLLQDADHVPENEDEQNYWRALCSRLDERVYPVIAALTAYGYIPIIIGGGHNNAYPIIKGTAYGLSLSSLQGISLEEHPLIKLACGQGDNQLGESLAKRPLKSEEAASKLAMALENLASGTVDRKQVSISDSICAEEISLAEAVRLHLQQSAGRIGPSEPDLGPLDDGGQHFIPISVVNCDPHGDFRALEGRHSGNPFSYAKLARYLNNYCLVNYHEGYNSANMLAYMRAQGVRAFSYESVFVRHEFSYADTLNFVIQLMSSSKDHIGLELDLDSIANMPSSAVSPYGISLGEAAFYTHAISASLPVIYAHFPEGAPCLAIGGDRTVGKGLALLVSSFIKGCSRYNCHLV
ncbi:MAG: arginase family protein [Candidatus Bruticola sp.]